MNMSSSDWGKALSTLLLTPGVWTSQLNIFYCRREYRQYRLCLRIKDPRRVVDLLILQYRAQLPHLFFYLTLQTSTIAKKRNNCKKLIFIVILCPVQATDCFVVEQWPLLKQILISATWNSSFLWNYQFQVLQEQYWDELAGNAIHEGIPFFLHAEAVTWGCPLESLIGVSCWHCAKQLSHRVTFEHPQTFTTVGML